MYDSIPVDDMDFEDIEWQKWLQGLVNSGIYPGFLLRFEVGGTNIAIAGTKDGGRAAILACSAQWG